MLARLGHRLLAGLAVVLGVVTLTFLLLHAAPGDPVDIMLGPTATAEQLAAQRRALGLDQPLPRQFATWVGRSARGDWGTSTARGGPVPAMWGPAWPATARLVVLSLILSYLIGLAVGALQAARSGSRLDTLLSVVSVTLFGIPGYWLGLMLVLVFTYWARLLPAFGIAGLDSDYLQGTSLLVDRLRHLALPLVTLTLIGIGGAARFVRGAMLETLSQPFITTAWAKGLTARRVVGRHALRNALTPVVILLGLSLPALFSGAVFVTNGEPTVQRDIVATRFVPPMSRDVNGVFHPIGTDRFGRDVWTRLVYGARVSMGVGVLAVLVAVILGVVVGALAGYWRGPLSVTLLALTDFALALPRVVLLLLLAALWQPSTLLVVAVLGLTGWMGIARLVHGEVRSLAVRPFVEGAVAVGARRLRILARHILPNALTPVIVAAALGVGNAIVLEAGLSYLGLGVQAPTPSLGHMITSGSGTPPNPPWGAIAPGGAPGPLV